MKHTVASTGCKEHKSEVSEALAPSLAEQNDLPAVRILEGCKHAGSDRGHQNSFIFGCHACAVHPVEPWLHVVAAGEGHDHTILTLDPILPPLQQDS